jgi:hypothetical protein
MSTGIFFVFVPLMPTRQMSWWPSLYKTKDMKEKRNTKNGQPCVLSPQMTPLPDDSYYSHISDVINPNVDDLFHLAFTISKFEEHDLALLTDETPNSQSTFLAVKILRLYYITANFILSSVMLPLGTVWLLSLPLLWLLPWLR